MGDGTLEGVLISALGTGILGIGGLIAWTIKSVVPQILATLEERTKALVTAVEKIPEALDRFETRMAESEARIIGKIDDRRIADLHHEIRRFNPDDTIPPGSKSLSPGQSRRR
jgi:hypothetical protein